MSLPEPLSFPVGLPLSQFINPSRLSLCLRLWNPLNRCVLTVPKGRGKWVVDRGSGRPKIAVSHQPSAVSRGPRDRV